jgi:hypothetical protein
MNGSNTSYAGFHTEYLRRGGLWCVYRFIADIEDNVVAIRSASTRVRQCILSLVALIAIGHANLTTDLTGRTPNASGITQLGRDILRKASGDIAENRLAR